MDDATKFLVGQGVLGVVCLGLAAAVVHLYRAQVALHTAWHAFAEKQIEILAVAKVKTEQIVSEYEEIAKGRRR